MRLKLGSIKLSEICLNPYLSVGDVKKKKKKKPRALASQRADTCIMCGEKKNLLYEKQPKQLYAFGFRVLCNLGVHIYTFVRLKKL